MDYCERFLKRKHVIAILGNGYILSDRQIRRLNVVFDKIGRPKIIEDWLPTISHMVKNDLNNYYGRLRRLISVGPKANNNDFGMWLRYGRTYKEIKVERDRSKTAHFDTVTSFWTNRGLSEEEALTKVSEKQKERAKISAEKLTGTSIHSCRSYSYWINKGLTLEQAQIEVKRVNGRQHTAERNIRWQNTLKAKPLMEREELNLKKGHSVAANMARGLSLEEATAASIRHYEKRSNYSKVSQKLFDMVYTRLTDEEKHDCFYKTLNYEKQIDNKNVDFYCCGYVVEFNGDYWHGNYSRYDPHFLIYGKTSQQRVKEDKQRYATVRPFVKGIGVVWEHEFKTTPDETIDVVLKFIRGIL